MSIDPFFDSAGNPRIVRGTNIPSNSPRIAEIAARLGFDTVWIELEHGTPGYGEVESLCRAIEAGGAVPSLRIQDIQRTHVLRAVETGARIVLAPMIDTAEQAHEFVRHGKYAPVGQRGFNTNSRGADYGLLPPAEAFEKANGRTHLFAQVETLESAANIEAICAVEGLAGIFVGPGDFSTAMGKCGQFSDPEVLGKITDVIAKARQAGKHVGIMATPGTPMHDACLDAGADLFYFGSDLSILINGWRAMLKTVEHTPMTR